MIDRLLAQELQVLETSLKILSTNQRELHSSVLVVIEQNKQLKQMLREVLKLQSNEDETMTDMASFATELKNKLSNMESAQQAAVALIQHLSAEVAANKYDPAALDALLAQVDNDAHGLATAVTTYTPAPASTGTNGATTDSTATADSTAEVVDPTPANSEIPPAPLAP